ncbi:hypothetical protein GN958_ATG07984, partial [Phytophthora infestans]
RSANVNGVFAEPEPISESPMTIFVEAEHAVSDVSAANLCVSTSEAAPGSTPLLFCDAVVEGHKLRMLVDLGVSHCIGKPGNVVPFPVEQKVNITARGFDGKSESRVPWLQQANPSIDWPRGMIRGLDAESGTHAADSRPDIAPFSWYTLEVKEFVGGLRAGAYAEIYRVEMRRTHKLDDVPTFVARPLHDFKDVMSDELPSGFLPERSIEHGMQMKPDAKTRKSVIWASSTRSITYVWG